MDGAAVDQLVQVNVRMPDSLRDAVRDRAKIEDRSFSVIVRRALRAYLNEPQEPNES